MRRRAAKQNTNSAPPPVATRGAERVTVTSAQSQAIPLHSEPYAALNRVHFEQRCDADRLKSSCCDASENIIPEAGASPSAGAVTALTSRRGSGGGGDCVRRELDSS